MSEDFTADGAGNADPPGERIGDVVERIRERRREAARRGTADSDGVLNDRLDTVEEQLLSFARELGCEVDDVTNLPFVGDVATTGMPDPLYVRHDQTLVDQVVAWLLQDQHVGVASDKGTGKTAFREVVLRDLRGHDDYVAAHLADPRETTPRQCYGTVLAAAARAGYDFDHDEFGHVRDGVPWATDEAREAVGDVAEAIREDGKRPVLVVDELEVLPEELLPALQSVADAGVQLFLLGTPAGRERLAEHSETLASRLRFYEGIDPFDADDVEEYVERSLAHARGEPYRGQGQSLFTRPAIEEIAQRTGGNPREVRVECRELFTRAAFVWAHTDHPVERVQVTPALRKRRFGMGS